MDEYKTRCIIPDMQIRLKQGDGRLIRSERDTGVVAILDIRASEGWPYHRWTLAALPKRRVTSSVAVVEKFILEKKGASYFPIEAERKEVAVK